MTYPTRQRRRRRNQTQSLMRLIGILLAVLIGVVIIALVVNKQPADPGDSGTTQTDPTTPQAVELTMSAPTQTQFTTMEQTLVLQGASDPAQPVTVAGVEVARNSDGTFIHTVQLQPGVNEITVSHKDKSIVYTVEYRYAVQTYSPAEQTGFNSGASIQVELVVREGSMLKVTLGDKEVEMAQAGNQLGEGVAEGFVRYTGTYELPGDNTQDLNLGKFTYAVTCNGVTETYYSEDVICKKAADILASDPGVTPDYGDYVDVGSGYIVEIITGTAETFNGATTDDYSDPRNNYLPEGTVDYCAKELVTQGKNSYRLLRCGRRVYIEKPNYPPPGQTTQVVDVYRGTLPDHNEIGFASLKVVENHTVLTLDTMWKAPFYFDFGPQEFSNPADRDFRVTKVTAEYVEITFCYATVFEGTVAIPADNPLFSSAQLTQNESDCTLRLNLKKTGGFYGWDAYYNENGQLCFTFLNPAKATAANNAYGADLTGTVIMLDVGHGGYDGGSEAKLADGTKIDEAELNLKLAMALKKELETTGATVILNRYDDASISVDERLMYLKEIAPDLCVAVHQNSISGYPDHGGAQVQYFTPYSQPAAQSIYEQINKSGVYTKTLLDWHLYYVARQSVCPVVLTENGFMTNAKDLANMVDDSAVQRKAESIARGVANYFLSI
ncbi:MAG: N-acetylmuramoyl-L-alanine amidase [Oscillospiraceae bacterium]|nr:N-acetylmuramoyl-L-alanine amidase [Oscillospiraceae bacterium]